MSQHDPSDMLELQRPTSQPSTLPRIRGWLLVYLTGLAVVTLHTTGLTVGSIVIYADPAVAGLQSFVPLSLLLFYVITNVTLIVYAAVLFALMRHRRRSAIVNNVLFNILSVAFLVGWHFLREKSLIGTTVDSMPSLIGAAYILMSSRVRRTFIVRGWSGTAEQQTQGRR